MVDIDSLLRERGGIKLDIGCGPNKQGPDWVGMDIAPYPGVDIVHDFNIHPFPLPDECVIAAIASHVIEHIPPVIITEKGTRFPFIEFMNEVWRIMKPDGQFAISYPHGNSSGFLQDPTHVHAMNEYVWLYFDPLARGGQFYGFYKPKPWKIKTDALGEPLLYFDPSQSVEVVLIKRREDWSYYE